MRSPVVAFLVLGCVAAAAAPVLAQRPGPRGEQDAARYGWVSSLQEGMDRARKTGKPLMVVLRCVP